MPGWLSFDAATRAFSGTPGDGDAGTLRVKVTASDGRGGRVSDIFAIAVSAIAPGAPRRFTATPGDGEATLGWRAPASNGGAVIRKYQYRRAVGTTVPSGAGWTDIPDGDDADSNAGNETGFVVSPLVNDTEYAFELRAVNAIGEGPAAGPRTATPGVDPRANRPPVPVDDIPDQAGMAGEAFRFEIPADAFEDPNGDELDYTAELENGSPLPAWLNFNTLARTFSGTPPDAQTLSVRVTASDARGGRASAVFEIAVAAPTAGSLIEGLEMNGDMLKMTFRLKLDPASNPSGDHFVVRIHRESRDYLGRPVSVVEFSPDAVAMSGKVLTLTMHGDNARARVGETVELSYDPARTNPGSHLVDPNATKIQFMDEDKTTLSKFDARAVTNVTRDTTPPELRGDLLTVDGAALTLTFDEPLDEDSAPAPGRLRRAGGRRRTSRWTRCR